MAVWGPGSVWRTPDGRTTSNRDGLGAVVTVSAGDLRITQIADGKSGYLSQSRLPLYFGLDTEESVDRIEVVWPSGVRQTLPGPHTANQLITIKEHRAGDSRPAS